MTVPKEDKLDFATTIKQNSFFIEKAIATDKEGEFCASEVKVVLERVVLAAYAQSQQERDDWWQDKLAKGVQGAVDTERAKFRKSQQTRNQQLQQLRDMMQFRYDRLPIPSNEGPVLRKYLDRLDIILSAGSSQESALKATATEETIKP